MVWFGRLYQFGFERLSPIEQEKNQTLNFAKNNIFMKLLHHVNLKRMKILKFWNNLIAIWLEGSILHNFVAAKKLNQWRCILCIFFLKFERKYSVEFHEKTIQMAMWKSTITLWISTGEKVCNSVHLVNVLCEWPLIFCLVRKC